VTKLHVYEDSHEGFRGYLAFAGDRSPLAAGGFRVQRGLTGETIAALAEAMQLKEGVLRVNVDGAKCGIDYDPRAPGKHAAMSRFLEWLRPHLEDRLSLGPDMGTTFSEIEALARPLGIPSVKAAIARAQELPEDQVLRRLLTLDSPAGGLTVGERRAGHALAHATFTAVRRLSGMRHPTTCALQGFGTLGRGAALTMHEAGVRVAAVADEFGSVRSVDGLDVRELLSLPRDAPVTDHAAPGVVAGRREDVFDVPADVIVLAACEDAMDLDEAARLRTPAVVIGANNGLRPEVEDALTARGVLVVPDFVAGAGGSAAMDALFAPPLCPDGFSVLARVALLVGELVERLLDRSQEDGVSARAAAVALAREAALPAGTRPYGLRLLETIERPTPGLDGAGRATCVPVREPV
jgi:glutamate dehydrogenase/leucine dehydrogenase